MKAGRLAKRNKASSALVITLLAIVLLTILVVGFMQTMSLSLTTAKSYADIQRATLAAQAGLDTAIAQISLATGTNLAFVTGQTNFPSASTAVTVIGEGNLTNLDQMMPLVSGPITYLTNFGYPGFSNNFSTYASPLVADTVAQTVDVNVQPYQFIQTTAASNTNTYRATWVTMTNMIGNKPSYTRFAYVVLDDTARVNPSLMTGTGIGMTNSTNWYSGPQDINVTLLTNGTTQALSSAQLAKVLSGTNAQGNAFGYSDATLGETFSNRTNYEAVKYLFTSSTNPSFDVIPAWYPSGGQPKYNINDLATNTAYGATGMARASNIANIIMSNLPNFYQRDPALTSFGNTNLYINRLAANIVDYISPDYPNNVFYNTDYTYSTNTSGISPQGHGIYPILIFEQLYIAGPGAGDGTGTKYTTSKVVTTFWLSCWNPYTTPVQVQSASLHVSSRPGYVLGTGPTNSIPDYTNSLYVISGANGTQVKSLPYTVQPNEFVVLGFGPQTNTITTTGASTATAPVSLSETNNISANGSTAPSTLEQYALNINGQTTAQSGANASFNGVGMSGGLTYIGQNSLSTNSIWIDDAIEVFGTEVADPRWASYFNTVWFSKGSQTDSYANSSYWKGASGQGGSRYWDAVFPAPGPSGASGVPQVVSLWANRDNIARSPANAGSVSTSQNTTPDTLPDRYNSNDSNSAPNVIRNGPMVSIGELGHIFDPASANDALTSLSPRTDDSGFTNNFTTGGARSLRIGRPEENGNLTTNGAAIGSGGAVASTWDTNGLRAIDLLDLFTVNNANTNSAGTNSIAQSMNNGGALGRINVNTASSNVLAAVLSGIQITSDPGMTNSSGTLLNQNGPVVLTNVPAMVNQLMTNRPYSSLSDLYKAMPMFDTNINYYPNPTVTPYLAYNDGGFAGTGNDPYLIYPSTLNVFNRVHQEAFGKLVQHLTVQSRSYRVYVIGQVLDNNQNPHGSIVMEAGIYLQYNAAEAKYNPVIQYVRLLNN